MWRLGRIGAGAVVALLAACTDSRPASPAAGTATPPPAGDAVTMTSSVQPQAVTGLHKLGQPFTLGDLRVTMLSVQDPFPPTAQVQPAPGSRLVSITYELVNLSSASRNLGDLPAPELRDSTGTSYPSQHGRLSMVGGAKQPGELPAASTWGAQPSSRSPHLRPVWRSPSAPWRRPAIKT